MIYLIGGAARVGKTTLAKMILERKCIPFTSTDMLWWALKESQTEQKWEEGWEKTPDQFFPFFRKFVDHAIQTLPDYVIEGDSFFPQHVSMLMKEFSGNIKVCFLGMSKMNLSDIKKYTKHNNWVDVMPQDHQEKLPIKLVADSEMFSNEAKKYGVTYFDLTENRNEKLEEAYKTFFS